MCLFQTDFLEPEGHRKMELCLRLPDAEHETFFSFRYSTVLEQEAIPSQNSELRDKKKLHQHILMQMTDKTRDSMMGEVNLGN